VAHASPYGDLGIRKLLIAAACDTGIPVSQAAVPARPPAGTAVCHTRYTSVTKASVTKCYCILGHHHMLEAALAGVTPASNIGHRIKIAMGNLLRTFPMVLAKQACTRAVRLNAAYSHL
jgi:hypothetical protein